MLLGDECHTVLVCILNLWWEALIQCVLNDFDCTGTELFRTGTFFTI